MFTLWYEGSTDRYELWVKNYDDGWKKLIEWESGDSHALGDLMFMLSGGHRYINSYVLKRSGIKGGD